LLDDLADIVGVAVIVNAIHDNLANSYLSFDGLVPRLKVDVERQTHDDSVQHDQNFLYVSAYGMSL
jgi:hypothetical protein